VQHLPAATRAENRDVHAASVLLETKFYKQAEESFARFAEDHADAEQKPQAILYQAQARFFQTNYAGALKLLQQESPKAGASADEYQFWIGQIYFKSGNFRAAADTFSALGKNFPESLRQIEASFDEALAESKLGGWARVIELLQSPEGIFSHLAGTRPDNAFVIEGNLLLVEGLLQQRNFAEGKKVLAQIEPRLTAPKTKWRGLNLLTRLQIAGQELETALQTATNLVAAARETGNRHNIGESVLLRGEIFEKLGRNAEAIQTYEQNFTETTPSEIRRESLFKIVSLNLAEGATTNAITRLENFIAQNAEDSSLDLALITLGELRLKQFVAATNGAVVSTNLFLEKAMTNFNSVIADYPHSSNLGKAHLDRGWCDWLKEDFAAAENDFKEAVRLLPVSADGAVARFKLAETQLRRANFPDSIANFQLLLRDYGKKEDVKTGLLEPALFQLARASIETGNAAEAESAMKRLLTEFSNSRFGEKSLLLVGGYFSRNGQPEEARKLFQDFLKTFPDARQTAEVKLALAQGLVQEKKWPEALAEYDAWVTNFAGSPLLAQGEFYRALTYEKAGQETNAFNLLTNYVTRFPSNELAALAQNWVADFFWNHGDYRNAEKSYQELYQKFNPAPPLAYEARLMAGRAAYGRSDYTEASKYYKKLIELLDQDTHAPGMIKADTWFALGEALFQNFLINTNWVTEDFREAIAALTRVTKDFPTNAVAGAAWGRMGDYYFQWAGLNEAEAVTRYQRAIECYGVARDAPAADVSTRSEGEVGVGNVCVKRAERETVANKKLWLDAALKSYANVWTEKNLREGESFDPKWFYEAGLAAAKICENSERWEQALEIYRRLQSRLP
ncbi:MAG: tetratricopeptide repeat protein, partial [Verrucomicrobiota bacterium]